MARVSDPARRRSSVCRLKDEKVVKTAAEADHHEKPQAFRSREAPWLRVRVPKKPMTNDPTMLDGDRSPRQAMADRCGRHGDSIARQRSGRAADRNQKTSLEIHSSLAPQWR